MDALKFTYYFRARHCTRMAKRSGALHVTPVLLRSDRVFLDAEKREINGRADRTDALIAFDSKYTG